VHNVICPECGFVYVAPAFTDASLAEYYADSMTYYKVDYSIENRLSVIERYSAGGTYVELGAKEKTEFHKRLETSFERVITQELGGDSHCDIVEISSLQAGAVDMVAHYFVLEHVPGVCLFLEDCRNLLKSGGIMVVEVPDLALYPHEIAALMLFEHTNHFSVEVLAHIARQIGFELLESGNDEASRPFGFFAVFRKVPLALGTESHLPTSTNAPGAPSSEVVIEGRRAFNQYDANKSAFMRGVEKAKDFYARVEETRECIDHWLNREMTILVWAANDNFDFLFAEKDIPAVGLTIIDSDPRKAGFVPGHTVYTPDAASAAIKSADAIVLCTGQWSAEILDSLQTGYNKAFDADKVRIVDYYFG